jgi:hypothetical protein
MSQRRVKVKYQIATYSGEIEVDIDENDLNDVGEAKARNQLLKKFGGSFPYGIQEFQVVESRYLDENDRD